MNTLFAKEGNIKAQTYLDNTKHIYKIDRLMTELQKTATPKDQLFEKLENS